MTLTRHSKVKEAWNHPVGHDLLQSMLERIGKSEHWLEKPAVANMPLLGLDRWAGPGFCELVLQMTGAAEEFGAVAATQQAWWKEAVVYQIYLPSFMDGDHDGMGDLIGVVRRLPYLARLGVNTLFLWPPSNERGRQDHAVQNWIPDDETDAIMFDFRILAEQAHALGMRVVISVNMASTTVEHPWFTQTLAGERKGFYILCPGTSDAPPNNWSRPDIPTVWKWYPQLSAWALKLHGPGRVDLDWENPDVRDAMAKVLRFWHEGGADGFYVGPVGMLSKSGLGDGCYAAEQMGPCGLEKYAWSPGMHRYLRELRSTLPPGMLMIGDACGAGSGVARLLCSPQRGELDMVMDTSHLAPCALRLKKCKSEKRLTLLELKRHYMSQMSECTGECWAPVVLETPDTPRIVSRLGTNPLYRMQLAKLLATMQFTLRGTPFIYQGQELGVTNTRFASPNELQDASTRHQLDVLSMRLGEAVAFQQVLPTAADHARTPMPWSAETNAGFSGAVPWQRLPDGVPFINAAMQMEDERSIWRHYERLVKLRQEYVCLIRGSFNPVFAESKKVFCYFRIYEGGKWYVEMNLTEREISRPGHISQNQRLMLSNYEALTHTLRPLEANLYRCE